MTVQVSAAAILKEVAEKEASLPTVNVNDRLLEQEQDLGNLLGWDENQIDCKLATDIENTNREKYLTKLARDNTQLLFNALWNLPTEKVQEALCIKLPPPSHQLPREKPVPKPKPLTKWEAYAKSKGIDKKSNKSKGGEEGKAGRLVWDDQVKEWLPKFGYKKAQAEQKKNWMMEIKDNADPMEDPFEKEIEAKKERVAKNEIKRLRNIARAQKVKVPGAQGVAPILGGKGSVQNSGQDLSKAAELAKSSTASLGKFQEKLSGKLEKANEASKKEKGPKRKFDPLVSESGTEKERNLKVLDMITSKKPKLDLNKAVGKQINKEDKEKSEEKSNARGKGRGSGRGGKGRKSKKGDFKNRGAGKNYGKGKKGTGGAAKKKGGGKRR